MFLSLAILILAGSIVAVAASESAIDDYSFTVPDNYTIENSTEHIVTLKNDDHEIVMSCLDDAISPDKFKARVKDDGFKIDEEENNFSAGIFNVKQYDISKDKEAGFLYICDEKDDDDGDDELFITFTYPADDKDHKADNNTVIDILKSIKEVDD